MANAKLDAECKRLLNPTCKGAISDKKFYQLAAQLLCEIADNTADGGGGGGGGGTPSPMAPEPVTWIPVGILDPQAVNITTYQTLLSDTHDKLYISIYNGTNEALLVSFDNGTSDHLYVTPGGSFTLRIGANGRIEDSNLSIKAAGALPTTGKVYASSYYGGNGEVTTDARWVPLAKIDVEVEDLTTYKILLSDSHEKLYVSVYNASNEAIMVSLNGGSTNHVPITAFGAHTFEFGEEGGTEPGSVAIKALDAGALPSSGAVYASAYY